ncbi:MAG: response regulator [Spirochaetales bacterium]|nr:response regulator [Spirochaetales bacterium]
MNKNRKILYLDDEFLNLRLFEMTFSKNHTVLTASDGIEGLEVLAVNPEIAIVISDMKMPNMNGYEFVTRAKEKYPNIMFAILSGYEITEELSVAMKKGVISKYFNKPFNVREIEAFLANSGE